jgi:hypothetical protein
MAARAGEVADKRKTTGFVGMIFNFSVEIKSKYDS